MNRRVGRPHTVAVVMAMSLAVVTACAHRSPGRDTAGNVPGRPGGSPAATPAASAAPQALPSATASPVPVVTPGAPSAAQLSISNGTADVVTDGLSTHFDSTVTDAAWSPDGSRLAYVDGYGNVVTALADGSGVITLTETDSRVKRAAPAWVGNGWGIEFSERGSDGVWRIRAVSPDRLDTDVRYIGDESHDSSHDTSPTTAYLPPNATDGGVSLTAFQHAGAHGPQVWILDYNQRTPEMSFVADGSSPTLSPNGRLVAFVGKGGQLYLEPVRPTKSTKPTQLTFGLTGISHPRFAPDGRRVVFSAGGAIESVSSKVAAGATANAVTVESHVNGVPSFRTGRPGSVNRFASGDPIADAVAVSRRYWNPYNDAQPYAGEGVRSRLYPDIVTIVGLDDRNALAMAGTGSLGAVLFNGRDSLDPRVTAELKRIESKALPQGHPSLQILGGTGEISGKVESALVKLGFDVTRVDDGDVAAVSVGNLNTVDPVVVVSDSDPAGLADVHLWRGPWQVLVIHGSALSSAAQYAIDHLQPVEGEKQVRVYPIGSAAVAAVTAAWSGRPALEVITLAAGDSQAESVKLAAAPWTPAQVSLVASGDWRGALLANSVGGPTIVVDPGTALGGAGRDWLRTESAALAGVLVFGPTVPAATVSDVTTLVAGPGGMVNGSLISHW
jgi:hypothetical protein